MNKPKIYYYRLLLPHGGIAGGLIRQSVEFDHSVRLRLEQETEGTVLTLLRVPSWISTLAELAHDASRRSLKVDDLAGFLRDMGVMLQAGVPVVEALRTLVEEGQAAGNSAISQLANRMADDLTSGMTVAESFMRHANVFPEVVCNLVAIGDKTGTLDLMLVEAALHVSRMLNIKRDIRTALIYPAFVFLSIFGVAGFWIFYVVPSMAQMFKQLNAKLPPLTLALLSFSNAVVNHSILISLLLLLLMAVGMLVRSNIPGVRRAVHEILHRLPVTRVLMTSSGMAHLTEHLAILQRAGLDFVLCLDILTRATKNLYYRHRLQSVRACIERGDGIANSMRRVGGFPAMAVRMIAIGEQTGSLQVQLTHLAKEYRRRLEVMVKSLSEIIKPIVILVAGALFIFLIVALLLPIYDLIQQSTKFSMGS